MTVGAHYRGKLYRALNPVWAADPYSGMGAAIYGGRFNPKGTAALYCSLSPHTALKEANQVGDLQPTTVIAYAAEIEAVFDARDAAALAEWDMTGEALADAGWRESMRRHGEAPTQAFARRLSGQGYTGILVPSFVRGATREDVNLVLWRWGDGPPARLVLIDDDNRLGTS